MGLFGYNLCSYLKQIVKALMSVQNLCVMISIEIHEDAVIMVAIILSKILRS